MSQYFSGSSTNYSLLSHISLKEDCLWALAFVLFFYIFLTLSLTLQSAVSVGGIVNSISILADSCRVFQTFPTLFKGFSFTLTSYVFTQTPQRFSFLSHCTVCVSKRCSKVWIIILNLCNFSLDHSAYNIGHQQTAKSWFPSWLRLFNRRVKCQGKSLGVRVSQLWKVESENYPYQGS